jgi:hypothetical protein
MVVEADMVLLVAVAAEVVLKEARTKGKMID